MRLAITHHGARRHCHLQQQQQLGHRLELQDDRLCSCRRMDFHGQAIMQEEGHAIKAWSQADGITDFTKAFIFVLQSNFCSLPPLQVTPVWIGRCRDSTLSPLALAGLCCSRLQDLQRKGCSRVPRVQGTHSLLYMIQFDEYALRLVCSPLNIANNGTGSCHAGDRQEQEERQHLREMEVGPMAIHYALHSTA